jgi:hypothetical protein
MVVSCYFLECRLSEGFNITPLKTKHICLIYKEPVFTAQ